MVGLCFGRRHFWDPLFSPVGVGVYTQRRCKCIAAMVFFQTLFPTPTPLCCQILHGVSSSPHKVKNNSEVFLGGEGEIS